MRKYLSYDMTKLIMMCMFHSFYHIFIAQHPNMEEKKYFLTLTPSLSEYKQCFSLSIKWLRW